MRASVVIAGLVAVLVGFGGSIAIILAAANELGATPGETSSWVTALCISMMVTTAILSVHHRTPIVTAWSTPGAALIAGSSGITMAEGVGAFLFVALLIVITALIRPLATAIEKIPTAVAAAMLAGVLFQFVVAIFDHVTGTPLLVLPLLLGFAALRLLWPIWAVPGVLALGIILVYALGMAKPLTELQISELVWVTPHFDAGVLLSVGVPLYLVTMASQNLPGFAVLRAAGYTVPTRSILSVTGLASLITAPFGAHTSNLAAITASICTGPDAHPDADKRWLCGPSYAAAYGILALFGASVVTVFASYPEALIVAVAGIALTGPLLNALSTSLNVEKDQFAAITTFVVTASGITAFELDAAFWGLLAGLGVYALPRLLRR
ncbi:MAG: benzoate/H(+) symporter BenE family transporter [Rhodospirillaceae bacterium]|nr:benzoate/H(+) symporter BenE family transporter [Rhodospirillaceae bacterium]